MKEKEQKGFGLNLNMTFDNKESLKDFVSKLGMAIDEGQTELLEDLAKKCSEDNKKDTKPFQPQKGDICTCVVNNNVDAIFIYNGKTRTDDDGDAWLDASISLTWSGDLFKPYMIVEGEGSECLLNLCRPATEEEIILLRSKLKDRKKTDCKEEKKWSVGDWVYAVGSETGCCRVFYPVPVTYAETKTMENLVRRGWVFDKEEECEVLCGKLNEAIKDVKS